MDMLAKLERKGEYLFSQEVHDALFAAHEYGIMHIDDYCYYEQQKAKYKADPANYNLKKSFSCPTATS